MKTPLPFELPDDPAELAAAAERLLTAYLLLRNQHVYAASLEADLDEAVAGRALYSDDEKLG